MIFGDHVRTPTSSAAGDAAVARCRGAWGTVGWFVPEGYAAYVRVPAPDAEQADWWEAYRSLFATVATVGAAHTSTPDRAWFAVWDGHGWETAQTLVAVDGPAGLRGRWRRRAAQASAHAEDARRRAAVREGLRDVPRVVRPQRTYYLAAGRVDAVTALRQPGSIDHWQRPDLWWPDDLRWFVATDVDCWSLYVGGSGAFAADLVDAVPTAAEHVTLDHALVAED